MTLNNREQRRCEILSRFSAGSVTSGEAARLLGVTVRQVRRLRTAFRLDGMASAVHGNKGRQPGHTTAPDSVAQILALTATGARYHDFNACHLQEILDEQHGITVGRSTLQRLLQAGRAEVAKAPAVYHRSCRDRSLAEGMMVQVDGSPEHWFEDRGPRTCLMGGIDDATSKVLHLHFRPTEDAAGYLLMFRQIAVTFGLPMSYYHDKHTILRSPKEATIDDELAGRVPMSHVQRVLYDLGVESIAANSPQAKGRIERLWATLQDRLIKEMRLDDIRTIEDANLFLKKFMPRFNKKFAKPAEDAETAWVEIDKGLDLDYYFSMQETRVVREDHTLSFNGKILQICPASRSRSLAGQKVTVRTNPEGVLYIYDGKKRLAFKAAPVGAPRPIPNHSMQIPNPNPKPIAPAAAARRRGFLYAQP